MNRAACCALLVAGAAQAQGFDFERQDISVDLTQTPITIDLDLTARRTRPSAVFDLLLPNLTLESIDSGGMSLTVVPHPMYPQVARQVQLPSAGAAGETVRLHARLSGPLKCQVPNRPVVECMS